MRRHLCFYPVVLPRKPCSKHMLHCSYCNPSRSWHHVFCFHTGNCTPPSAHHFMIALRQKQSAECSSLHWPTGWRDTEWWAQANIIQMLCKSHTVTFCIQSHFEEVCLPSKIFLDPTNGYAAQNKMASRSHDCPQWAEADPQPGSRKENRRVKKAIVMPRSGFGPVDVIVVHNSWSVQPPSTNGPLLIICLLTDSAMTFLELRPHRRQLP